MTVEPFPTKTPPPAPAPIAGDRARRIGVIVLVAGVVLAGAVYGVRTYFAGPRPEDLLSNYQAANERQMGLMYGNSGVLMWDWLEALKQPGTEAVVILVVAALVALICFRVAWVEAEEARNP